MKPNRGLSQIFINALKEDSSLGLNRLLKTIKNDHTLCMEIRKNYVNIYYRGGNLIKLEENNGKFTASFNRKYILSPQKTKIPEQIGQPKKLGNFDDISIWIDSIPFIKYEMDLWFSKKHEDECEAQQIMVRENNYGRSAKSSDYFICDIEYANEFGRFDMIAAYWPSSSASRKDNTNVGLAFLEMKYMNSAMSKSSGIYEHICDMASYFQKRKDNFESLKQEMRVIFNQKLELGLIDNQKQIVSFNKEPPEFILVLVNSDPDSTILLRELNKIKPIVNTLPFELKFAVSNFMGYGLYKQNMYNMEEFMSKFPEQIYAKIFFPEKKNEHERF